MEMIFEETVVFMKTEYGQYNNSVVLLLSLNTSTGTTIAVQLIKTQNKYNLEPKETSCQPKVINSLSEQATVQLEDRIYPCSILFMVISILHYQTKTDEKTLKKTKKNNKSSSSGA